MQIRNLKGALLREVSGYSLAGADLGGADLGGADLLGADLRGADLRGANLSGADLRGVDLSEASLRMADLTGAILCTADLRCANLSGANLSGADLREANLRWAVLREADLTKANLTGADLYRANLYRANLSATVLPPSITPTEGDFLGYKKVLQVDGTYAVITLRIPADAQRTSALASRKCRACHVEVVEGEGISPTTIRSKLRYAPGAVVTADRFNADRREECTYGIHFFLTREEAEAYQP